MDASGSSPIIAMVLRPTRIIKTALVILLRRVLILHFRGTPVSSHRTVVSAIHPRGGAASLFTTMGVFRTVQNIQECVAVAGR